MQKRVEALEEKMEQKQSLSEHDILIMKENIKSELINEQDDHIIEMYNELKLRDNKKLNLCISGLKADDNKSDIALLKDLFTSELGLNTNEVEKMSNCKRFATKNNKQLIIASFVCKDVRRTILKKATKLKNYRTSENTSVFISPDLTKKQQLMNFELRKALKAKKESGNDVIIRNNQIVPRYPAANQISTTILTDSVTDSFTSSDTFPHSCNRPPTF